MRLCWTRWLRLLRRLPALIGRRLLKLLRLALRWLLAGALLLRLLTHGTLLLAHGVFVLTLHLVLLTVQFRLLALQLLLRPLRLLCCIAFIRRPRIGRGDRHAAIYGLLIALQFLLAALRRLWLLCLGVLSLFARHALWPQGGFALQALRSLLARHLWLLMQGLAPYPLIDLWRAGIECGNRQGAHGGRLNQGCRRSRRNGCAKLARREGGATLKATRARVIGLLICTMGRTEKGLSVITALALAAHDALRCQAGRRQGGGCWPRAFVQLLALGHRAGACQHLGATQVGGAQDVRAAGRPATVGKVVPAGRRHGSGLVLVAVNLGAIHRVVYGEVVHAADIARTDPVGRPKDFAGCQREPAQGGPGCVARADGKAP